MISCTDEVRVGKFDELHQRCVDQRIGIDVRPDDVTRISLMTVRGSDATRAMSLNAGEQPGYVRTCGWGRENTVNLLSGPDNRHVRAITMVMEAEQWRRGRNPRASISTGRKKASRPIPTPVFQREYKTGYLRMEGNPRAS
ncbi:hypothetical protein KCP69_27010 (plasmid) [Salmonella enterica subsp. enterica]|nr:hypothetical protein KCP69_27010 [Salmonella enterica subsp. enterica]